jgi:hypothetical protein
LTEFINWQSIFLQKTYSIDAEFFGKMKIAKNREQYTETSNVGGKQEHEALFFILIFIFLSNLGNKSENCPICGVNKKE